MLPSLTLVAVLLTRLAFTNCHSIQHQHDVRSEATYKTDCGQRTESGGVSIFFAHQTSCQMSFFGAVDGQSVQFEARSSRNRNFDAGPDGGKIRMAKGEVSIGSHREVWRSYLIDVQGAPDGEQAIQITMDAGLEVRLGGQLAGGASQAAPSLITSELPTCSRVHDRPPLPIYTLSTRSVGCQWRDALTHVRRTLCSDSTSEVDDEWHQHQGRQGVTVLAVSEVTALNLRLVADYYVSMGGNMTWRAAVTQEVRCLQVDRPFEGRLNTFWCPVGTAELRLFDAFVLQATCQPLHSCGRLDECVALLFIYSLCLVGAVLMLLVIVGRVKGRLAVALICIVTLTMVAILVLLLYYRPA